MQFACMYNVCVFMYTYVCYTLYAYMSACIYKVPYYNYMYWMVNLPASGLLCLL